MGALLTAQQVAERLQVEPETVRRLARTGRLPHFRIGVSPRSPLRFQAEDVERFIEARKAAAAVAAQRRTQAALTK